MVKKCVGRQVVSAIGWVRRVLMVFCCGVLRPLPARAGIQVAVLGNLSVARVESLR